MWAVVPRSGAMQVGIAPLELELLAIVYRLSYFKHYLYGAKVYVDTDRKALEFLKTAPVRGRIARWGLILASYDYEVFYGKCSSHGNADAISRRPYAPYDEHGEDEFLTDNPNLP